MIVAEEEVLIAMNSLPKCISAVRESPNLACSETYRPKNWRHASTGLAALKSVGFEANTAALLTLSNYYISSKSDSAKLIARTLMLPQLNTGTNTTSGDLNLLSTEVSGTL